MALTFKNLLSRESSRPSNAAIGVSRVPQEMEKRMGTSNGSVNRMIRKPSFPEFFLEVSNIETEFFKIKHKPKKNTSSLLRQNKKIVE